jgi:hypothetical protein
VSKRLSQCSLTPAMVESRPSRDDRDSGMARKRKIRFLALRNATSRGMPPGRHANVTNRVWTGKISAWRLLFGPLFDTVSIIVWILASIFFTLQNLAELQSRQLEPGDARSSQSK